MTKSPAFFAALLLGGCAAAPGFLGSDRVSASAMQARLQYRGFSIARPGQEAWYTSVREQSPVHAVIRRDLPTPTHTAFVSVNLRSLPRAATSRSDFAALARQDKILDTKRFVLVSYHQRATTFQGQWAVMYDVTVSDTQAPNSAGTSLTIRQRGYVVRHPSVPNAVLLITFSERGTTDELDVKIEAEGKDIISGVRIESAPAQPTT